MSNLRVAREAKGISQKEVAITLGVSRPTVSEWENDKKKPSRKRLLELSKLYSCSVDYLLGVNDAPPPLPIPKEKSDTLKGQKEIRHMEMYRKTAPEIRAAVDKLLETYEWAMKRAEDINNGYEKI